MTASNKTHDSLWTLSIDLWSAKTLVWLASVGRDAVLTSEAHLFFCDRYRRLGRWHNAHGNAIKAARLAQKAAEHLRAGAAMNHHMQPPWHGRDRSAWS